MSFLLQLRRIFSPRGFTQYPLLRCRQSESAMQGDKSGVITNESASGIMTTPPALGESLSCWKPIRQPGIKHIPGVQIIPALRSIVLGLTNLLNLNNENNLEDLTCNIPTNPGGMENLGFGHVHTKEHRDKNSQTSFQETVDSRPKNIYNANE
ncbi:MAG: hypothetical protein ACOYZ8_18155 [Chloroflexota bacterium]